MTDMSKHRSRSQIHLMNQEFRAYGNHLSADNGAIHLALMIWFIGMNDTNVMECTSLYYKLTAPVWDWDSYWQFVYCSRRVLGMGAWEGESMDNVENYGMVEQKVLLLFYNLHISDNLHLFDYLCLFDNLNLFS